MKAAFVSMICATGSAPAAAQSFFEQLFGLASPPRPALQAPPQRLGTIGVPRPSLAPLTGEDEYEANTRSSALRARDDGRTYQTMCVRTCDGYYWPATYPVSRSDFKREADVCQATCGAQTRLFYRPDPGTDPEEMRDMEGRSYGATPNAFAYRKGLIDGCACKPMPWSDGERARHEGYALIEAEKVLRAQQAEAERLAAIEAAAQARAAKIAAVAPKPELPSRAEFLISPADDGVRTAVAVVAAVPVLSALEPLVLTDAAVPHAVAGSGVAQEMAGLAARGRSRSKSRRENAESVSPPPEKRVAAPAIRAAPRVQMAVSQPKPAVGLFGLGTSGGKYTYPGDR